VIVGPSELGKKAHYVAVIPRDRPATLPASRLAAAGFQLRPGGDRLVVFAGDGEAMVPGLIRVFRTLAVSGFGKPE
jgi:hypothetical protein